MGVHTLHRVEKREKSDFLVGGEGQSAHKRSRVCTCDQVAISSNNDDIFRWCISFIDTFYS